MDSWTIIDKSSSSDKNSGIVHHNEGISNFSVKVSNVLQTNKFKGIPKFQCAVKCPYICIYFENTILIFADTKCETVKLHKTFSSNICGLLIRENENSLVVIIESGILYSIDLITRHVSFTTRPITDEKFSKLYIYEEKNDSFILASNSLMYQRLTIVSTQNENITFKVNRIKYSELSEKLLYNIEINEKNIQTVNNTSICLKCMNENDLFGVCPITNQNIQLTETIKGKSVITFSSTDRFLLLQETSKGLELCIADLYKFNIEFRIPVTPDCFVVGGIEDSAIYLDIKDEKIYIYQIQENSPLSQLEILIAARNYEGAEAFAKSNNLSPAAVLELKAKCLLTNLKKQFSLEHLEELKEILSSCDNVDFILNCCLEGAESHVNLATLLEYAKKYLDKVDNHAIKSSLNELLWKKELFELMEFEEIENMILWEELVTEQPLELLIKFLSNDQLDLASLVWVKCYPYIIHNLTQQNVSELLYSVSAETKLNGLLRWLEYFIPNIINIRPFSTDIIINWAKEKISSLENSKHWPEIGIQLAEKLSPLIFNAKVIVNFVSIEAEKFHFFVHCLKNIQILKKSFNIIISLKDFMSLGREELAKLILRKAFSEDLDSLFTDYLESYEIRYGINRDNLIKKHIEEVINASPIVDEHKMEILLRYINNAEEKLKCILLVLKSAQIPWSTKVYNIANTTSDTHHELSRSIKMEIVHAEIKGILMKYKCHELSSEDYEYLIRHIIKKGNPEMLSDIEKVTSVYRCLQDDAYLMCIQKYLQCSQVNHALKLYERMEDSFKIMCVNFALLKLENLLSSDLMKEDIENSYLDFLNSIHLENSIILDHLYNIFILKNKLKFKISLHEYSIEEYRRLIFKTWCANVANNLNRKSSNVKEFLVLSVRIGNCLKLTKAESILTLLHEVEPNAQSAFADFIFGSKYCFLDDDIKSVDIIVLLIRYIDGSNINILSNALKHIFKILLTCNYMSLSSHLINICIWILVIYYSHNNTKEILSTWKICSFYNPHVISSIIPLWCDLMSKNISSTNDDFSLCMCDSNSCNDGSVCLKQILGNLQLQQNDVHFSRILAYCTMKNLQNNSLCQSWLHELNDNMVKVLIGKMVASEQQDTLNISMLIFCHSSPEDWLSEMLSGFVDTHRKINVAQYILQCKEMFQHINIPYKQAFSVYSENNIASKLEKYGIISSKEYQSENTICGVKLMMESLVNIESFNILTLEEFCLVTGISLDQALMLYLFSIFKSLNTNYTIETDSYGVSNVAIQLIKPELMRKSYSIIERIQSKKDLVTNLTTLLNNGELNFQNLTTVAISQYSYEVFLFIIDILKGINSEQTFMKQFILLKFLQTYQRVSKPNQAELDIYSVKETFPKIGFYRLPFQFLISAEYWNNIKPEFTLANYERWLPIAGLLPLDVEMQIRIDMICSSAVRESMTQRKSLNESMNIKWSLNLHNEHLLKEAHNCIQHIMNLEWAGACFYYVYQGSVIGADQVAAANMCYQFAEHWSKIQPNNILKKMQSKRQLTLTAHILHKSGLADEKLLALCDNPHRLIEALYNHNSILTHTECPNINAAVDDIADSNGLNSSTIRMNILEGILSQSKAHHVHMHNTSVHIQSGLIDDGTLSKGLLMKACYILKGTNPMMAAVYLSHIALDVNDTLENYTKRIRALQCLISLVENDVIEKVTHFTVISLWSKLWELYFINYLSIVGLEFLTATLLENKMEALQQIWSAQEHNYYTVSFVVKLMFIYNLKLKESLLDEIVQSMLKFGMLSEIRDFLFTAKSFYSASYIEAWSTVLLNPFKQLDTPLTANQKENCYNTLKLLPTCPVTLQIDLAAAWSKSINHGALDMAAVILPHVSEVDRKKIVMKLGKIQPSLLQDIKSLKSKGILTTNIALAVLKQNYRSRATTAT